MSVYSAKTGLSSILKAYNTDDRDRAKIAAINKVRFELPKEKSVSGILESVINVGNYVAYNEFITYIRDVNLNDDEFLRTISEARKVVHLLRPSFQLLAEALLSLEFKKRHKAAVEEFCEFVVDLLVAHNKYTLFAISKLISYWIPDIEDEARWPNFRPDDSVKNELEDIHKLIKRLLETIPLTYDVVRDAIDKFFPYYKKPTHVVCGYLHNVLWLLDYKPELGEFATILIYKKLVLLDVNAPRNEIEDAEYDDADLDDVPMFPMEEDEKETETKMGHPLAETLDVCMSKMFEQIDNLLNAQNPNCLNISLVFKHNYKAFEDVILPSHNTHHVQFLLFYLTNIKPMFVSKFISNLWEKVTNLNVSAPLRQAAVGYMTSFLARSKNIGLRTLTSRLSDMCSWAHQYIENCDSIRSKHTVKANIVFYSVCQGIFYVIAFRSRDLTRDKQSLLFLQSLQLSALVTCNFNPLRYCIPTVATAFAGVTRTYQLAYCHAILERNARRRLATVYINEASMPDECLDTFFPFDPYLLKKSGNQIAPFYLQYQPNESEEQICTDQIRRKRGEPEMDDIDDFIVDKKSRISEISPNCKEIQFTYGLSPGFHT